MIKLNRGFRPIYQQKIIDSCRRSTLQGVHILFSGVIPTNFDPHMYGKKMQCNFNCA